MKHVGSELIRRREGDRIGLVVFAENAFAAAPLSFDVHAVSRHLSEMEIGLVGRSTAIGEGLGTRAETAHRFDVADAHRDPRYPTARTTPAPANPPPWPPWRNSSA